MLNNVCTVCGYSQTTPDEYFIFTELSDGTYEIKAKDVNNMPAEVILPSTYNGKDVTSIGFNAFQYCTSLTSITIPDSVTYIDFGAFYGCSSLTGVYITDIAAWYNISFGYSSANPLYYAKNLYLNNQLVTELVIPDSVTSIGNYAFEGCCSLTGITIPDSVTSIGDWAFPGCSSLTSVTIGNGVTSIGACAFSGCSSLTSITIPEGRYFYWRGCVI